ncbi:hypothetical protein Tco_1063016 [Tanacetum coccineum]
MRAQQTDVKVRKKRRLHSKFRLNFGQVRTAEGMEPAIGESVKVELLKWDAITIETRRQREISAMRGWNSGSLRVEATVGELLLLSRVKISMSELSILEYALQCEIEYVDIVQFTKGVGATLGNECHTSDLHSDVICLQIEAHVGSSGDNDDK